MSFSPLEVAKVRSFGYTHRRTDPLQAFEAPLLAGFNSNSSGRQMARAAGDAEVQYGETRHVVLHGGSAYPEQKRLAFAAPQFISDPQKNEKFDV